MYYMNTWENNNLLLETSERALARAWIDGSYMASIRNHHSAQMYKYILNGDTYRSMYRYIGNNAYYNGKKAEDPILSKKVGDYIVYDIISTTFLSPNDVIFGEEEEGNGLYTFLNPDAGILRLKNFKGFNIEEYADWYNQGEVLTCGKFKVTSIENEEFSFYAEEDTSLLDDMDIDYDIDEEEGVGYYKLKVYTLEYVNDVKEQRIALHNLLRDKLKNNRNSSTTDNYYYKSKDLDKKDKEGLIET